MRTSILKDPQRQSEVWLVPNLGCGGVGWGGNGREQNRQELYVKVTFLLEEGVKNDERKLYNITFTGEGMYRVK